MPFGLGLVELVILLVLTIGIPLAIIVAAGWFIMRILDRRNPPPAAGASQHPEG